MMLKLSARNQLRGTITKVQDGAVNGIVTIDVNGTPVTADISMASIHDLDLKQGVQAVAVIKATEVMVGKGQLTLSARNQFPGEVIGINSGAVNDIVQIRALGGNTVSATITDAAVKDLDLHIGDEVVAMMKSTSVMVGRDE